MQDYTSKIRINGHVVADGKNALIPRIGERVVILGKQCLCQDVTYAIGTIGVDVTVDLKEI